MDMDMDLDVCMDTGTDRNMDTDMDRDADPVNEAMAIFIVSYKKFANYRTVQTFLTTEETS
jgi:hypothetical protein